MKNFFKREHSENYFNSYLPKVKDKFNCENIESTPRFKVMQCFHVGEEVDFLAYRFDVLNDWMKMNERYVQPYINRLSVVINNLCLQEEFNSFEKQRIFDLEAIIFAKWRNLKQLIVDFKMYDGEFVFYRYEINSFHKANNKQDRELKDLDLFITTKRIVIAKNLYTVSLDYKIIKNYHISKSSIIIELKSGYSYEIKCDNTYVIYVSLERVLKREKIIFN